MSKNYSLLYNAAIKVGRISENERKSILELYSFHGKKRVYETVTKKNILPFVSKLFCSLNIDYKFWNEKLSFFRERNENVIQNLNLIYQKLDESDVRKIFVSENFATLLSADGDKALFASSDVDNYADISEKSKIYAVFNSLGYSIEERYCYNHLVSTSFYNLDKFEDGFHFVVGWNPLSRMKLPELVNADDFVDWNDLRKYGNTSITLPPDDALMYICLLHISLHSFARTPDIRLYRDIVDASQKNVNWEKIMVWSFKHNTTNRLITGAYLSNKLAAVEFPDDVLLAANKKAVKRILTFVYDESTNNLKYHPSGLRLLLIEIFCFDGGVISAIKAMIFPDKIWLHATYGNKTTWSYIRHWKNLLK